MALRQRDRKPARATGHIAHDAQVRIDERVAKILARRASDRRAARTAALRRTQPGHVETPHEQ
jgi:hypothetical protein